MSDKPLTVTALICIYCDTGIYPRARFDYIECRCSRTLIAWKQGLAIAYKRRQQKTSKTSTMQYTLPEEVTKKILFNDFFYDINMYGRIQNISRSSSIR